MATRLYLPSSGSAAVTPSTWNFPTQAATTYTYAALRAKISSAFANRAGATGTTSPTHRGMVRYVFGPLSAQTISGTVKGQVRGYESATGANATLGVAVKLIQPGGTDRAVLLAYTASDTTTTPPEFPLTTATNRQMLNASEVAAIPLTSQSATAGDYLVVELGWRSATTTSRTIYLRVGDNSSSDLPEDNTSTLDYAPWIEFSQTLAFPQTLTGTTISTGSQVYAPPLVEAEPDQQIARPIADVSDGTWTASSGSDLFEMLNETTASDADYITSAAAPSSDTATLTLTPIIRPEDGACVLTVRVQRI